MRRPAVMLLVLVGCAGTPPAPSGAKTQGLAAQPSPAGASVSDITLGNYPGPGKHSFSSDRGQVVVIDAWATWCAPCVRSLPQLQALRRDYAKRGVRVYAVSVDEDRAQIPSFLAAARVDLPVLLDPGGFVLEDKLKLKQMPTTWVVDRNGHVRYTQESFDGNLEDIRAQVDALLKDGQ
ncbi:MAG: TlpA family protein disulfide reductase [Myxococcaceae bacterium]|nr:MAG: TlpA family protein disulfide reductase [Myxococcaceae bacterium]